MADEDVTRRRLLAAGLAAMGGLAGCGTSERDPTASPTTATRTTTRSPRTDTPSTASPTPPSGPALDGVPADALGCTHTDGTYDFTDDPYLAEGARVIASLGLRTIRVWDHRLAEQYSFDSDWPAAGRSLVGRYSHPYFQTLFEGPFDTYHLTSYAAANTDTPSSNYWREGVSDAQFAAEAQAYDDAATHLLETYRGTGTTFVFGHWEGDWSILHSFDPTREPTSDRVDAMIRWLDARQAGIARARERVESDVTVLNSTSVNLVRSAMTAGDRRVINAVVPETNVDLVAYSCYDLLADVARTGAIPQAGPELIRSTLSYVHEHAPTPSAYVRDAIGDRPNVFVGEFGWPLVEDREAGLALLRVLARTALDWGVPWALYWQVFDNELQTEVEGRPDNDDVRGFYLVRPDGTRVDSWSLLRSLLDELGGPPSTPITLTP